MIKSAIWLGVLLLAAAGVAKPTDATAQVRSTKVLLVLIEQSALPNEAAVIVRGRNAGAPDAILLSSSNSSPEMLSGAVRLLQSLRSQDPTPTRLSRVSISRAIGPITGSGERAQNLYRELVQSESVADPGYGNVKMLLVELDR